MPTDHDISVINNLITTTIDSAKGFENSAENIESSQLRQFFNEMAQERRQVVGRLQEHVRMHGGTPNDDGSLTGSLHQRWEDLRNALGGGDKSIIEEVERGEDYIKEKYEQAMQDQQLSPECRQIVQEAYQSVRKGHDRARDLKHSFQRAV